MEFSKFSVSNIFDSKEVKSKNGVIKNEIDKVDHAVIRKYLTEIDIDKIIENPDQARSYIDEKALTSLKNSIRREGLLHPLVVFKNAKDDQYTLKAGHRRLMALKELGFTKVDCHVLKNDKQASIVAVTTNEFAEDIHPIDKGVEVMSLMNSLESSSHQDVMSIIMSIYGVGRGTIREWKRYALIRKDVRAKIISLNIRDKIFLRKVVKICSQVDSDNNLSESRKSEIINEKVEKEIKKFEAVKNCKQDNKELKSLEYGPETSNFLVYKRADKKFHIRKDAIKSLNARERKKLKAAAEELLELV